MLLQYNHKNLQDWAVGIYIKTSLKTIVNIYTIPLHISIPQVIQCILHVVKLHIDSLHSLCIQHKHGFFKCSSVAPVLSCNYIAPDKAAYCVFTQFRGPENAIKLISVRTKTQ